MKRSASRVRAPEAGQSAHTLYYPLTPVYGRPEFRRAAPRREIPQSPMAPDSAYEMITNELLLDASAGLNLATFCNETTSDPWSERLVVENIRKNFIDHSEYPASNIAEQRAIWMLAREFGTEFRKGDEDPDTSTNTYGSATIGSSEAVMLGLIAHKYRWITQNRKNLHAGRADAQDRPVVLMSAHVHTCWDKFCNYYGAVALYVEIDGPPYTIDGEIVAEILNTRIEDEKSKYAAAIRERLGYLHNQGDRTIGELVMCVGAVVGTTYTGNIDDVPGIDAAVERYCRRAPKDLGINIPIHVDGASGGFVTLFSRNGDEIRYRFHETRRVSSINTSNHKYGLTFPGMGSVVFRNADVVDPSLVYVIDYLGGSFTDYTVNFSRGSNMILMQYYNFLCFGRDGYSDIINNCLDNTATLLRDIQRSSILAPLLKNISNSRYLPMAVFTWADGIKRPGWDLADLSNEVRQDGWVVPSYVLPRTWPDQQIQPPDGTQVLRVVVQQAVTADKLNKLITSLENAVTTLNTSGPAPSRRRSRRIRGSMC